MGNGISVNVNVNVVSKSLSYGNKEDSMTTESKLVRKYTMERASATDKPLQCESPRTTIMKQSKISIEAAKTWLSKYDFKDQNVALIFCNSYYMTRNDLGDCAINDGILARQEFERLGYHAIIYYDVPSSTFIDQMKKFLEQGCKNLAVYFIGHGTQQQDKFKNEKDAKNECFVFKDKLVLDDQLSTMINEHNKCNKLWLIADACHSGTIYDIPPRDDIITISSCLDSQTSKQDYFNRKGNGVFSYYFWKSLSEMNDEYDTNKLIDKINLKLAIYNQRCNLNHIPDKLFSTD